MSLESVLVGLILAAAIVIAYLLGTRRQPTPPPTAPVLDPRIENAINSLPGLRDELGGLKNAVQSLPSNNTVEAIEKRVGKLEEIVDRRLPTTLPDNLREMDNAIKSIRGEYEPGKRIPEIHEATQRLMTVLAGGSGRGQAGELILAEVLREFPPSMLERDFKVDGKQVEFALVLPDGKRVPIDSKWAASDLLEKLEKITEPVAREALISEVESNVSQRAREVAKYLNPAVTTHIGIAAVPDAAYRHCRKAHIQAYQDKNVLVIPYSMAAPYLLALYNVHLKYGQAIELSNLQGYLTVIEQEVKNIDADLEGRVKEAGTRADNAYQSIKAALAKIRAAMDYLRSTPGPDSPGAQGTSEPDRKSS
ncbi:MAG: DNA recombination protein RmuC [Terriglobia bacterium]